MACALVGRGLADLLRRLVLLGAQRFDLRDAACGLRVVRGEHLVDQAGAHALAFDAAPILRLVAQPLQVDHASASRICSRNDSTQVDACFHALPTARRRSTPASAGPPTGYEPRNFTSPCLAREVAQRVGDHLVGDVTFAVDEEAVVAESLLGRARLELGEVHVAGRELLEDAEQRARAVLALEAHDRRLVVTGGRGHAATHEHEAGLVLGMVLDVGGEHLEPVEIGGQRVADRGEVAALRPGDLASGVRGGVRGPGLGGRRASWRASPGTARSRAGNDTTVRTSARATPGGAHRLSDTGRSISRWISSSLSKASVSSVTDTEPSIMFSIGTTPPSASPRSTAAITSGTDPCGIRVPAARSACDSSASSVKVPAGPKYATRGTRES